ncbi:TniQ family protein [Kitasatospora sp. NPDC002040]|uniref:TniQ family protein n=1 Tax=Kitasatospora sp. NPDC002040 TaxID=3154661 RepID=UPI0033333639
MEITASAVVRRLPFFVKPQAGEAFASWITRAAFDLGVGPGQFAHVLGLEMRRASEVTRPAFFGVILTDQSRQGLRLSTGLPESVLEGMQLACYGDSLLDLSGLDVATETSLRTVWTSQWVQLYASRCCPLCLRSGTVWPLWWRLEAAAICPVHSCLLLDECPSCGIRFRRGNYGLHRGLLARRGAMDPRLCGNRSHRSTESLPGLCEQVIADLPVTALSDTHVLSMQERLLQAADGSRMSVFGERVSAREWVSCLRYFAAMVRSMSGESETGRLPAALRSRFASYLARRESMGRLGPKLQSGPATSTDAAAVFALTAPMMLSSDLEQAAKEVEPWVLRLVAHRVKNKIRDPLGHIDRPAPLDSLIRRLTPQYRRVIGPATALPRTTGISLQHLPHLLAERDYDDLISRHMHRTHAVTGRLMAAVALAKHVSGSDTWAAAAEALGMERDVAERVTGGIGNRIADSAGFWQGVGEASLRLKERGLVDYAARRAALSTLRRVPLEDLTVMCRQTGIRATDQRSRYAAVWIWTETTGGDHRKSPGFAGAWHGVSQGGNDLGWWKFRQNVQPILREPLSAWAARLLAASGVH